VSAMTTPRTARRYQSQSGIDPYSTEEGDFLSICNELAR
jgi:hypothetical protein